MKSIRVLLADDHPVLRDGIRNILEQESDMRVVGQAATGDEALQLAIDTHPDVLLLDMELPGLTGVEVARRLRKEGSSVRVLALSAHADAHYVRGLLASGAAGYLTKEEAPATIVEAVRGVAYGEEGWLSRRVAATMTTLASQTDSGSHTLTEREVEVLHLVVDGMTNQEIGGALGISDKTVEKHLESVFSKLGVASRTEAAVHAVRHGVV
jgi:DNA-binding NarL/FixJ family response regulator